MPHRRLPSPRSSLCAVALAVPCAAFALPNPASVFCAQMGGRTEAARLADGSEIGLCFLPDRRIIEEWTFFRMHNRHPSGGAGVMPGAAAPQSR